MFNLCSNNTNYAGLILLLCSKLCKHNVAARTLSIWFCSEAGITFIYATNTPCYAQIYTQGLDEPQHEKFTNSFFSATSD